MKLRLPGPFIACVIAEFLVYDLQMQQRGRRWRSLFFFFFFSFFYSGRQICRDCWGREGVKKQNLQTAILSDNWNVSLMFGDSYTSVQRDSHLQVQSGCYRRSMSKCSWNSWLGSKSPCCYAPELGFCEVTKWICFSLWWSYALYTTGHNILEADNMTVHFVYSYFYLAHVILLSFYQWGCF